MRPAPKQTPTAGRIVHYTLSEVDSPKAAHRVRPAIVIDADGDACNLHVFTNGGRDDLSLIHWKGNVQYDEGGKPGTWRWIPFVPAREAPKSVNAAPTPPPAPMPAPPAKSLRGLVAAEKTYERPITDRYSTISDVRLDLPFEDDDPPEDSR